MKYFLFIIIISCSFLFSTCCNIEPLGDEFCVDQLFLESKNVPLEFTYKVSKTGKFIEAHKLRGSDIQKALGVQGTNFKVKRIELTSAAIAYSRETDNTSAALFASLAVVDNSLQLAPLTKKDLLLPLVDVPATLFSPAVNINQELNEKGVQELKKILAVYFDLLNDEGISFMLLGEGSPITTYAHFQLKVNLWLSISYEICRYAPLGQGISVCK